MNDNESHIDFVPPLGFRKVQHGWRSRAVHLYCVKCGVPAEILPAADDAKSDPR